MKRNCSGQLERRSTLLLSCSIIKPTAQDDLSVAVSCGYNRKEMDDDDYPKRLHNLSTQMTPGSSSTPWG